MSNDNHDEHGRFSAGSGGGPAHAGGHANSVPNGKPGSAFTKGYRMADGTYVPPQNKAALGRAVAAKYNGGKSGKGFFSGSNYQIVMGK